MKITGTDGKEVTAATTNTGFIISRGASLLLSVTTTSTGNKLWEVLKTCITATRGYS